MPGYDLKSLNLPKIIGRALPAAARVLETPLAGPLALRKLLADAGVTAWRDLATDHPPAFTSRSPAPGAGDAPEPVPLAAPGGAGGFGPYATAADYTRQYAQGGPGPEDAAARALAAIRDSRELNHFVSVHEEDVMGQARASAARWAAGRPLSPLDGVPVAVKDEVDVAGYPTFVGTAFLGKTPAAADATSVARLRAAGALILGKAAMHEVGINPTGQNVHTGAAKNPWDPARDTGGSSSGPAG
ncbi:MAG: amidase family protein, partial [Pseudomonadota bacterium]